MEYEGDMIAVYDDQNLPLECDIISKFKNEETGKSYLVYTDNSRNEEGRKNMFVVSYRPDIPEEDRANTGRDCGGMGIYQRFPSGTA